MRPSDAGPLCRHPHPLDPTVHVECAACGATCDVRGASRCQGAVPDLCGSYLCEICEVRCWGCNLPVCEEHRQIVDGHVSCDECRRVIFAEVVDNALAAIAALSEVA